MDLALNIKGDGSGGADALRDVASEAQDTAAAVEQAFASMAKKTDAAFQQMERATADAAKKAAKEAEDAAKHAAEAIAAANKKMAEEGAAAWKRAEEAEKSNAAQLAKVKAGLLAAGAAAVAFGVESVKAFAEAERVQLQLERAAGEYAGALGRQADALESQLAIDGELIKQQMTLLSQWGAAPGQIEPTVRAIEDYAAATGKDALTATMELIKGVETGGAKFKALGVDYEETGDKTKDLARLTQALTEKFGGAAATNANSLQGSLDKVDIAFGNVKESFGELIAKMEEKMGVIQKTSSFLQGWASRMGDAKGIGETLLALSPFGHGGALVDAFMGGPQITTEQITTPETFPTYPTGFSLKDLGAKTTEQLEAEEAQKKRFAAAESHAEKMENLRTKNAESMRNAIKDEMEVDETALRKDRENYAAELELEAKRVADAQKESEERVKIRRDMLLAIEKANAEHAEKEAQAAIKEQEKAAKESADRAAKQAAEWKSAGDQIGAAFVNGLSEQLSKLAAGEEFDVAIFVGELLASAIAVAGNVIGAAYGQPALGAALGNLAAMGVRAGAGAISKANKPKKPKTMHSGGWVGDEIDIPRHHSGAWIGGDERAAILQTGERVLARNEVHHMGGPAAVDRMARGGPGVSVYVQAIDSKSAAESFMSDLGRGMKHALRTGQGDVPRLLGVAPR